LPIRWTDDLATGVAEIDEQHRNLYAAVAGLHGSMRQGSVDSVPETLEFLRSYALQHFATEERHMVAAGYPGLAEHRSAHEAFVAEFTRLEAAFAERGAQPSLVVELSDWLGQWLRDHVRRVDGAMGRFLASVPKRK